MNFFHIIHILGLTYFFHGWIKTILPEVLYMLKHKKIRAEGPDQKSLFFIFMHITGFFVLISWAVSLVVNWNEIDSFVVPLLKFK